MDLQLKNRALEANSMNKLARCRFAGKWHKTAVLIRTRPKTIPNSYLIMQQVAVVSWYCYECKKTALWIQGRVRHCEHGVKKWVVKKPKTMTSKPDQRQTFPRRLMQKNSIWVCSMMLSMKWDVLTKQREGKTTGQKCNGRSWHETENFDFAIGKAEIDRFSSINSWNMSVSYSVQ